MLFAGGIACLLLFLWAERRSPHPILDVAFLVRNRAFALSTLASFINYSSIFGVTFYFSLYLQGVHGLSLLETGLLLSAQPAIQVFVSPLGGRMADRHGADVIATIGIAVCGVGLLLGSGVEARDVAVDRGAGAACDRGGHRPFRLAQHQRDHEQRGSGAYGAGVRPRGYGADARHPVEHGRHFP